MYKTNVYWFRLNLAFFAFPPFRSQCTFQGVPMGYPPLVRLGLRLGLRSTYPWVIFLCTWFLIVFSLLSGRNVRWSHRVLPPCESL